MVLLIAFFTFGAIDATRIPFLPVHHRPHELLVVDVAVRVLLAGEELRERFGGRIEMIFFNTLGELKGRHQRNTIFVSCLIHKMCNYD